MPTLQLNYKNTCMLAVAILISSETYAAVGLEDICIYYNATSSTTTGFKLPARVSIWQKNIKCGTITVDPGSESCYYYKQSTACLTTATAATIVMAEPLYVNNTLTIPMSAAYTLVGTSGTTSVEHLTLGNGAWVSTAATPSVITAGTAYTLTADYLEPGFNALGDSASK